MRHEARERPAMTERAKRVARYCVAVLQRATETQRLEAVHDLLASRNDDVRTAAQREWASAKAKQGEAATFQPGFDQTVFQNVAKRSLTALRRRATEAAAMSMIAAVIEAVSPEDATTFVSVAQAAPEDSQLIEGEIPAELGLEQAYGVLEDLTEFVDTTDPNGEPVIALPSYETYSTGNSEDLFTETLKRVQQRIDRIAAGDEVYKDVLIRKAAHNCILPEAFQPPPSLIEHWLKAETLTSDLKHYRPGSTTMVDIQASLKQGDEAATAQAIADFLVYNYYNKSIEDFFALIEDNKVSPPLQKAIALKVAAHDFVDGSNSARAFYQRLSGHPLANDREVQLAFKLAFTEVSRQRNEYSYETSTPLQLPHVRSAAALDGEVELIVHPFYGLSQIRDFFYNGRPSQPDVTNPTEAQQRLQAEVAYLFRIGLDGRLQDFLRAIDLLEQHRLLIDRDPDKTYVVVLPKLEDSSSELVAAADQRWATQAAYYMNSYAGNEQPANMYYVESQTEATGYMFPDDLRILVHDNPSAHYRVSGESPKRCVSNAISDLPPTRIVADASGLSIDERELDNFLLTDEHFRSEMEAMREQVRSTLAGQSLTTLAEWQVFYSSHQDLFAPYHQFAAQLFQPNIDRHGLVLE